MRVRQQESRPGARLDEGRLERLQVEPAAHVERHRTRLHQHLRELHGRHVEDGAVVVLDNATGEVLAWVGSSGLLSQAGEVDGVTAARQPGQLNESDLRLATQQLAKRLERI